MTKTMTTMTKIQWSSGRRRSCKRRHSSTTNNDNNASKPPTMLMSRPTTEQQEEAWRQEKTRRMMKNNNNNALRPPMTMTKTMSTMTMSCQSSPFFIFLFFIVWLIVIGMSFFGRKYRCQHHQFCVGNTDPSGQNWSDILCWDDMSPTSWQYFQLSLEVYRVPTHRISTC